MTLLSSEFSSITQSIKSLTLVKKYSQQSLFVEGIVWYKKTKVDICGVDTSQLPTLKHKENY